MINLCPDCKEPMVPQNRTVWCLKCEGKAIQDIRDDAFDELYDTAEFEVLPD